MSEGEVADLKSAKEKLMTDAQALFQKVYEQTQATGNAAGGPDMSGFNGQDAGQSAGGSQNYGDDVVDADYKEV